MEFTLNIKLDASEKLLACIESLKAALQVKPEKREIPYIAAPKAEDVLMAKDDGPKGTVEVLEEMKAENPAVETLVESLDLAPAEYTEEDVRKAMKAVRARIETGDDGYDKYHKELTHTFLLMAAELGAEKPSQIVPDKRDLFISECEQITVIDGKVTKKVPF